VFGGAARLVNVVIGASASGILVLAFLFLVIIRKLRYETDLAENMTWKIRFEDIKMKEQARQEEDRPQQQGMLSFKFNNLIGQNLSAGPSNALSNPVRRSADISSTTSDHEHNSEHVSTNIGEYHGQEVAISRLRKRSVQLTREVLIELKQVRDLSHENLNPFIGACIESLHILLVGLTAKREASRMCWQMTRTR